MANYTPDQLRDEIATLGVEKYQLQIVAESICRLDPHEALAPERLRQFQRMARNALKGALAPCPATFPR